MSAKRFVVVVNPRGGTRCGAAVLEAVKPIFDAAGAQLDVHMTTYAGHARELAKTLKLDDYDGFCVVGGDGTIHEVVGGLMQQDHPVSTPLGVIPAGTGNSVLRHFECTDPREAARRIVAGNTQPLDVIRVVMENALEFSVNIVGWGAAVDINGTAERLRALGPPRYAVAALSHILRARRRRATLLLDGQVFEDEFLLAVACNTKFAAKGMQLAPRAETSDGKMDVVVVRRASRMQLVRLFSRVYAGSHLSLPCVEYHQVRSFGIRSESRDLLNVDGELKGATPLSADVMPAALRVFTLR
ncbi:MAG: diacylglycerol kinase family protein [Pirellulaceae bacterium]